MMLNKMVLVVESDAFCRCRREGRATATDFLVGGLGLESLFGNLRFKALL